MERRRKWGQHRRKADGAGTHSDRCRQSPENTSLKCMRLSTILSGCRLPSPWPWPGVICQPNPSRTRSFLCAETCRQTGGFEGPQPRTAQSFEAKRKLEMQASKKGKLGGGKEDIAALFLLILFFFFFWLEERWCPVLTFTLSAPACLWRWIFASKPQRIGRKTGLFSSDEEAGKSPLLTIIQMTDIIKNSRLSAGWTGK